MAGADRFRLALHQKGQLVYITDFDAEGTYSTSPNVKNAVIFEDLNRAYSAKAFLEACHPCKGFAMIRTVPIPCRVLGLSAASLLASADG